MRVGLKIAIIGAGMGGLASAADYAVVVVGDTVALTGECRSTATLGLQGGQVALLGAGACMESGYGYDNRAGLNPPAGGTAARPGDAVALNAAPAGSGNSSNSLQVGASAERSREKRAR